MPVFGVTVAVLAEGRVLLQWRANQPVWNLPGGLVEPGESLVETGVREVREETGLVVRPTRLVGVYSRPRWRAGGNHQVLFAAEPIAGDLADYDPRETRAARFFAPGALPTDLVWWHRRWIADALAGGGGGVARALDVLWPPGWELREVLARAARDPALAARLRALFCDPPAPGSERTEVEAS